MQRRAQRRIVIDTSTDCSADCSLHGVSTVLNSELWKLDIEHKIQFAVANEEQNIFSSNKVDYFLFILWLAI